MQAAWFGDFTGLGPVALPVTHLIKLHDLPFALLNHMILPSPKPVTVLTTRALCYSALVF